MLEVRDRCADLGGEVAGTEMEDEELFGLYPAGGIKGFGEDGVVGRGAVFFGEEGGFVDEEAGAFAGGFDRVFAVASVADKGDVFGAEDGIAAEVADELPDRARGTVGELFFYLVLFFKDAVADCGQVAVLDREGADEMFAGDLERVVFVGRNRVEAGGI